MRRAFPGKTCGAARPCKRTERHARVEAACRVSRPGQGQDRDDHVSTRRRNGFELPPKNAALLRGQLLLERNRVPRAMHREPRRTAGFFFCAANLRSHMPKTQHWQWYVEEFAPTEQHHHAIDEVFFSGRSDFQQIAVASLAGLRQDARARRRYAELAGRRTDLSRGARPSGAGRRLRIAARC